MDKRWLTSDECIEMLGVTKATLYAYVSRGKLAASPGHAHGTSRYRRSDVERLVGLRTRGRRPRDAARAALAWGLPVLESQLTSVENQQLHYRGESAIGLARRASLEEVACLLWRCGPDDAFGGVAPKVTAGWARPLATLSALPQADRMLAVFTLLQATGTVADGQASAGVLAGHAGALLRLSCAAALGRSASRGSAHEQFASAWKLPAGSADAVRSALVLCADHELNASSFVARCVASTGADLSKAVVAGLAALSGSLHGGMTARVEAMWDEVSRASTLRIGLERRVARGDHISGFGHPLYPDGDPRASEILARLPRGAVSTAASRFVQHVDALTGTRPTIDFALVALRRAIGAPEGGAFAMFAVGRTVGWLAHAIEQRATGALIRPRAAYTGVRPAEPDASVSTSMQPKRPASVFAR